MLEVAVVASDGGVSMIRILKKYLLVVLGIVIMVLDASVVSAQLAEEYIQDLVAANHVLAQHDVFDGLYLFLNDFRKCPQSNNVTQIQK